MTNTNTTAHTDAKTAPRVSLDSWAVLLALAAAILADRQPLALPKPVVTFLLLVPALAILIRQPTVRVRLGAS